KAAGSVVTPTAGFAYVDSRALFERLYSTLRPFAMMWAGGSQYFDLSKLPATETISKHLAPIVYSHENTDGGSRTESVGPVTISQVAAVALAGATVAGTMKVEEQMKSQPPGAGAFPGIPGASAPGTFQTPGSWQGRGMSVPS